MASCHCKIRWQAIEDINEAKRHQHIQKQPSLPADVFISRSRDNANGLMEVFRASK